MVILQEEDCVLAFGCNSSKLRNSGLYSCVIGGQLGLGSNSDHTICRMPRSVLKHIPKEPGAGFVLGGGSSFLIPNRALHENTTISRLEVASVKSMVVDPILHGIRIVFLGITL